MSTRALTTSEANQRLIEMGFLPDGYSNRISDNEFTKPFGLTYTNPNPKTEKHYNIFKEEWEDLVDISDRIYYTLDIYEYGDGRSYLFIRQVVGNDGTTIFNYAKANAATKKRFMEVMEREANKKQ